MAKDKEALIEVEALEKANLIHNTEKTYIGPFPSTIYKIYDVTNLLLEIEKDNINKEEEMEI